MEQPTNNYNMRVSIASQMLGCFYYEIKSIGKSSFAISILRDSWFDKLNRLTSWYANKDIEQYNSWKVHFN